MFMTTTFINLHTGKCTCVHYCCPMKQYVLYEFNMKCFTMYMEKLCKTTVATDSLDNSMVFSKLFPLCVLSILKSYTAMIR